MRAPTRPAGISPVALPTIGIAATLPNRPVAASGRVRARRVEPRQPIGQRLVARGELAPGDLVRALAIQAREDARLGEILLSNGMVTRPALMEALADQWQAAVIDLTRYPPDTRLIDEAGVAACLEGGFVPWRRAGRATVVATARPDRFFIIEAALKARFGIVAMALTTEEEVARAVTSVRSRSLALRAAARVPEEMSCRGLPSGPPKRLLAALGCGLSALAITAPAALFAGLLAWAALWLAATSALKLAALFLALRDAVRSRPGVFTSARRNDPAIARLPVVSMLVPLFGEADIAGHLLERLGRLTYPRELSDILLVCEEDDATTKEALRRTELPHWIRVVTVPRGGVQTKPRALNYALDFCRGQIVGVWDAEDAPEPDQLHKVVRHFTRRGPDVACLQGVLDYYNARTNWLSRCFTVEYASWFRVVLPGLERLSLPLPLGGTTLFFRRAALEELGGWDAHNVTEDADLGMRMARAGYRTEMVDTVTREEANCRVLPWIRQRSRWLKGYALTWAVHMRRPGQLMRELGPWRFAGFQVLFLGTLTSFVMAPLLWSCWALVLGLPHPLSGMFSPAVKAGLIGLFLGSEAVTILLGLVALRIAGKASLAPWVPTLHFYYPLASFAVYKGLWEVLGRPFFWDKTVHGLHAEQGGIDTDGGETRPPDEVDATIAANPTCPPPPGPRGARPESIAAQ